MGDQDYGEAAGPVTGAERVPCPRCGDGILPGARKCPHCRSFLDAALAEDRRMQIEAQVDYLVESQILTETVKHYVIASAIASFLLCFIGVIGGPATLGYALYYQHRARLLQMPELPRIRLLFAFAGLWTATGAIAVVAFIILVRSR